MRTFSALAGLLALSGAVSAASWKNYNTEPPKAFPKDTPLPSSFAQQKTDAIIEKFTNLGRSTTWNLVETVQMEGDTGEPEGMVRIGEDRWVISGGIWTTPTVKFPNNTWINGTDRSNGAGWAKLLVYDSKGALLDNVTLSAEGAAEYHVGGIDYSAGYLWVTASQYRPFSTATVLRIDPHTYNVTEILKHKDHLGGIAVNPGERTIATLNWGSRNATVWKASLVSNSKSSIDPLNWEFAAPSIDGVFAKPDAVVRNPSSYVDYQDCRFLGNAERYHGRAVMICSGVGPVLGGLAVVDVETMVPLYEVPLTLRSKTGGMMSQNPFDVDVVDGKIRFWFMPEQHNSTMYIYEA
jgi:hypothetical protein